MTGDALYNEIDDYAAEWLENLIAAGRIAPGVVDRRSIEDLDPDYVRRFRQVHLFAGIGIWSGALRGAGWPDDRRILTGSCPCQPFSAAGQGNGFADERHLWPAMFHLAVQCDFDVIVGEQVASKDGLAWLDLVQSDLEGAGYAVGAVDMAAAGFGAPHIRQRLFWVAVANARHDGPQGRVPWGSDAGRQAFDGSAGRDGAIGVSGGLALPDHAQRGPDLARGNDHDGPDAGRRENSGDVGAGGGRGGLADAPYGDGWSGECAAQAGAGPDGEWRRGLASGGAGVRLADDAGDGRGEERTDAGRRLVRNGPEGFAAGLERGGGDDRPGPVNGVWGAVDWLHCRDGRWRPVEPGTFPLAHALPRSMGAMGAGLRGLVDMAGLDKRSLAAAKRFRTGTLRGFGNAIVGAEAQAFCETVLELVP